MDAITPSAPSSAAQPPDTIVRDKAVAYAFWFFLGFLGAHRFWWGKTKSAVAMLLLPFAGIGAMLLGGAGLAAGASLSSLAGAVAGGGAIALGFAMFAASAAWTLLDAVFILTWPARAP